MTNNRREVKKDWGANTRVSLPVAPAGKRIVKVGAGFAFSENGLVFDISDSEVEEMSIPPFSPDSEAF